MSPCDGTCDNPNCYAKRSTHPGNRSLDNPIYTEAQMADTRHTLQLKLTDAYEDLGEARSELEQERHQLYLRIQNELDATNARLVVEAKLMIAQEALAAIMYDSIEPYTTICRNALKKINNQ